MELHYLPACQREWCIFDATVARSPLDEANLRDRITRSIDVTLQIDGHKWTRQTLVKYGTAFETIARECPHINVNELGHKLVKSYHHHEGRAGFETDDPHVASLLFDGDLRRNGARFILAIGHLQR